MEVLVANMQTEAVYASTNGVVSLAKSICRFVGTKMDDGFGIVSKLLVECFCGFLDFERFLICVQEALGFGVLIANLIDCCVSLLTPFFKISLPSFSSPLAYISLLASGDDDSERSRSLATGAEGRASDGALFSNAPRIVRLFPKAALSSGTVFFLTQSLLVWTQPAARTVMARHRP